MNLLYINLNNKDYNCKTLNTYPGFFSSLNKIYGIQLVKFGSVM